MSSQQQNDEWNIQATIRDPIDCFQNSYKGCFATALEGKIFAGVQYFLSWAEMLNMLCGLS